MRIGCLEIEDDKWADFVRDYSRHNPFAMQNIPDNIIAAQSGFVGMNIQPAIWKKMSGILFQGPRLHNHKSQVVRLWANRLLGQKAGNKDKTASVDSVSMKQYRNSQIWVGRINTSFQRHRPKGVTEDKFMQQINNQAFYPDLSLSADSPVNKFLDDLEKIHTEILDLSVKHNLIPHEAMTKWQTAKAKNKAAGKQYVYFPRLWDNRRNEAMMIDLGMGQKDLWDLLERSFFASQGITFKDMFVDIITKQLKAMQQGKEIPDVKYRAYLKIFGLAGKEPNSIDPDKFKAIFGETVDPRIDKMAERVSEAFLKLYAERLSSPNYRWADNDIISGQQNDVVGFMDELKKNKRAYGLDDVDDQIFDNMSNSLNFDVLPQKKIAGMGEDKTTNIQRFMYRIPLDYGTSITLENGNVIRMGDFYKNDVLALNELYVKRMAGHIALGEYGIDTYLPNSGFENVLEAIKLDAAENGIPYNDIKDALDSLTEIYNMTIGRIYTKEYTDFDRQFHSALSYARAWGHLTMLGGAGMSAMAETSQVMFEVGLGAIIRNFKDIFQKRLSKLDPDEMKASTQLLDLTQYNELDRLSFVRWGGFTDDDFLLKGVKGDMRKQRLLHWFHRSTGLTHITVLSRRIAVFGIADNIWNKGVRLNKMLKSQLGLENDDIISIHNQIEQYGKTKGKRVLDYGFDRWDKDIKEKFRQAIFMYTETIVSNPMNNALRQHAEGPIGKFLLSVLQYLQSTTNLLTSISRRVAGGDVSAVRGLVAAGTMGWLIYYLKSHMAASGRSDEQEILRRRLGDGGEDSIQKQIKGALSYVGPASPVFWVWERYTRPDYGGNVWLPPLLSNIVRGSDAIGTAAENLIDPHEQMTEGELRNFFRLLPWSNHYAGKKLMNEFANSLGN